VVVVESTVCIPFAQAGISHPTVFSMLKGKGLFVGGRRKLHTVNIHIPDTCSTSIRRGGGAREKGNGEGGKGRQACQGSSLVLRDMIRMSGNPIDGEFSSRVKQSFMADQGSDVSFAGSLCYSASRLYV
jgi:hypothetical protein